MIQPPEHHLPFLTVMAETEESSPAWPVASVTMLVLPRSEICRQEELDDSERKHYHDLLAAQLDMLPLDDPVRPALRGMLTLCDPTCDPGVKTRSALMASRLLTLADALEKQAHGRTSQPALAAHVRGLVRW